MEEYDRSKRIEVWDRIQNGTASARDHELAFQWAEMEQSRWTSQASPTEKWMMGSGGECYDCWLNDTFVPERVSHTLKHIYLFAVLVGKAEIDNGGFDYFFENSAGVLAPELLVGFEQLQMPKIVEILSFALARFGFPYPRKLDLRREVIKTKRISCDDLNEDFFELSGSNFVSRADSYFLQLEREK